MKNIKWKIFPKLTQMISTIRNSTPKNKYGDTLINRHWRKRLTICSVFLLVSNSSSSQNAPIGHQSSRNQLSNTQPLSVINYNHLHTLVFDKPAGKLQQVRNTKLEFSLCVGPIQVIDHNLADQSIMMRRQLIAPESRLFQLHTIAQKKENQQKLPISHSKVKSAIEQARSPSQIRQTMRIANEHRDKKPDLIKLQKIRV